MAELPATEDSLLVRTDFGDQWKWQLTLKAALAENNDGFRAYVTVVDDVAFDGASWQELRDIVKATSPHASALFVVDKEACDTRIQFGSWTWTLRSVLHSDA